MSTTDAPPANPPVRRTQDHMTHDVWLPDEIIELRLQARSAVEKRLAPFAREIGHREESADSFPWSAFRGLADEGMFAVPFGPEYGRGLQHPMLGTCTVTEEIAYHSSSMAGVYDGQCILVPQTLTYASEELRRQLIPELISGQTAFSFATTEPETSSTSPPSACTPWPRTPRRAMWSTAASGGSRTASWRVGCRCWCAPAPVATERRCC